MKISPAQRKSTCCTLMVYLGMVFAGCATPLDGIRKCNEVDQQADQILLNDQSYMKQCEEVNEGLVKLYKTIHKLQETHPEIIHEIIKDFDAMKYTMLVHERLSSGNYATMPGQKNTPHHFLGNGNWEPATINEITQYNRNRIREMKEHLPRIVNKYAKTSPSDISSPQNIIESKKNNILSPRPVPNHDDFAAGTIPAGHSGLAKLEVGLERQFVIQALGTPKFTSSTGTEEMIEYAVTDSTAPTATPRRLVIRMKSGQVASWQIKE